MARRRIFRDVCGKGGPRRLRGGRCVEIHKVAKSAERLRHCLPPCRRRSPGRGNLYPGRAAGFSAIAPI